MQIQQHFHKTVRQAAAGDIHNYAEQTLWDCSNEELAVEAESCSRGLQQLHKELWRSAPGVWLMVGAVGLFIVLPWLEVQGDYAGAWFLAMVFVPGMWWQRSYASLALDRALYTERLALIRAVQRMRRRAGR